MASLAERLEERYRFLGYQPEVTLTDREGVLEVTVRESRFRIALITRDPAELSRIGVASRREDGEIPTSPDRIPDWILRQQLLAVEGDYDNMERYRQERFRLAPLGYDIAFIQGEAAPGASHESAAYLLVRGGMGGGDLPAGPEGDPREETNYVGGSVEYGPRRGFTGRAVYRKWRWLTPFDTLEASPSYSGGPGGDLRYRTDYLFPGSFARRNVSTALRVFSDLLPNRPIGGVETDERREGVRVSLGVELFPGQKRHDLQARFEYERSRLSFDSDLLTPEAENFSFLRLSTPYTFRHRFRPPSFRLRVDPSLSWALGRLGGEVSYLFAGLDAGLHGYSFHRLEVDFHFSAGWLDRPVPLSEELRMGGGRTVRGFREEEFSGRRVASLQSELWFPLSGPGREGGGFYRRLKGAFLLDVGFVSGGRVDPPTTALGVGAGLRFQIPRHPLLVKFDYAIGFQDGRREGHPYLSLAYIY